MMKPTSKSKAPFPKPQWLRDSKGKRVGLILPS